MISTALALGALIGLSMGLTGAGGGVLAVPALMMSLNLSLPQASPIALTAVAIAAAAGAAQGLRQGTVRYRAALLMAALGALAAPLGTQLAHRLPPAALSLLFAAVMLLIAGRMLRQSLSRCAAPIATDDTLPAKPCQLSRESGRVIWNRKAAATLGGIGAASGFLTGLLGVGGGFFIVPALAHFTNIGMHGIVATSLMVVALISMASVAATAAAGLLVFPPAAWWFIAMVVAGMMVGRRLAPRVPARALQSGFAAICVLVAAILIWQSLS